MAEDKKITDPEIESKISDEETAADAPASSKKANKEVKKDAKPNIFVRIGRKIAKLTKDTAGELKKVTWTPKAEVFKNFKLVIATVVAVGLAIAVVDVASSWIINSIAGLIG